MFSSDIYWLAYLMGFFLMYCFMLVSWTTDTNLLLMLTAGETQNELDNGELLFDRVAALICRRPWWTQAWASVGVFCQLEITTEAAAFYPNSDRSICFHERKSGDRCQKIAVEIFVFWASGVIPWRNDSILSGQMCHKL